MQKSIWMSGTMLYTKEGQLLNQGSFQSILLKISMVIASRGLTNSLPSFIFLRKVCYFFTKRQLTTNQLQSDQRSEVHYFLRGDTGTSFKKQNKIFLQKVPVGFQCFSRNLKFYHPVDTARAAARFANQSQSKKNNLRNPNRMRGR